MPTAIIVHGLMGNPHRDWMQWMTKHLNARGYRVFAPQMDKSYFPKQDAWVKSLSDLADISKGKLVLVGHSLGGVAVLRFLEKFKGKAELVVLVATPAWKHSLTLRSFFSKPFAWNRIREKAKRFVIIHSRDDPFVPFENAEILCEKLGAKLIDVEGYGHLHSIREEDVLDAMAKEMKIKEAKMKA